MIKENTILLVEPPRFFKKKLFDKRVIIYRDWFFHFYDHDLKKFKKLSIKDIPIFKEKNFVISKNKITINLLFKIWHRWLRDEPNIKSIEKNLLVDVIKIRQFLKSKKVRKVIYYTYTPHHIDNSIISYCSYSLSIKEIFIFKATVFNECHLIIEGSGIFSSQKLTKKKYSNYKINKNLKLFISNLKKNNKKTYVQKHRWVHTNFYLALLKIFIQYLFYKIFLKKNYVALKSGINFKTSLKDALNQKKFIRYYDLKCIKNTNFEKKINSKSKIIIAAHYQPEASTIPLGGKFKNHRDIIFKIRSLGYDQTIYYKEHNDSKMFIKDRIGSTGVGSVRSISYLNDLSKLNVKFLPYEMDLIHNYKDWIVTITGKIVLERSFRGLYTIIAGNSWLNQIPGAIHIEKINLGILKGKPPLPNNYLIKEVTKFVKSNLDNKILPSTSNMIDFQKAYQIFINKVLKEI